MAVFGSSGTRGVVNDAITPAFVEELAAVAGTMWGADRVAIGRDTRQSGSMFANAASSGFASAGVNVERVGVLPTPALQRYSAVEAIPGCMITASHNPPKYTGVKLFGRDGIELCGEALVALEEAYQAVRRTRARWDAIGQERRVDDVGRAYVDDIIAQVDHESIQEAGMTVAFDPGHGAGIETTGRLLRELGCRVIGINDTPDGTFPGRDPEPTPDALGRLSTLVASTDAAIGFAHDGDADRVMVVASDGTVIPGESVLALLADAVVRPDDMVVCAVDISERVERAVEGAGGRLVRTPIGSSNLVEKILELWEAGESVPLAGEGNGGIFLPDYRLARDGAYVAARLLELAIHEPLDERAAAHTGYTLVRREIPYGSPEERARYLGAIEEIANGVDASVDRTDGVRVAVDDGWALARPSGTEPLIRIVAEARDPERASALADRIERAVETR